MSSRWIVAVLVFVGLAGCQAGGTRASGTSPDPDEGRTFTALVTAAEGGQLATASGGAVLDVPPGALADDVELSVTVQSVQGDAMTSTYRYLPEGTRFLKPVGLSIQYEGTPVVGSRAALGLWTDQAWTEVPGSSLGDGRIAGTITHFSDYAGIEVPVSPDTEVVEGTDVVFKDTPLPDTSDDAAPDLTGDADARVDVATDTLLDVATDPPGDVAADAPADVPADAKVDAPSDVPADVAVDSVDVGPACTSAAECDDQNVCTDDLCLPDGTCSHLGNTHGCDDDNQCTSDDACVDGVCTGTEKACDDGDPCTADACVKATGTCVAPPAVDGTTCDDGRTCTTGDACHSGVCMPEVVDCGCVTDAECDDHNPCTDDACDADLHKCVSIPNEDNCNDGNACTEYDWCQDGVCLGDPAWCNDDNLCTDDVCDPVNGCSPQPNALPCDDNDLCTEIDTCQAGSCQGTTVVCREPTECEAYVSCRWDKGCVASWKPDYAPCDDHDLCTWGDHCMLGVCQTQPADCGGANTCHTVAACDPATGDCADEPLPDGTACDDGSLCTSDGTCSEGDCQLGTPTVTCGPEDTCHEAGQCYRDTGECFYPPKSDAPCDDGDLCTGGDRCDGNGKCTGRWPVYCNEPDACHLPGVCDSATGECTYEPGPDGVTCDDRDECTQASSCQAGACVGTNPIVCPPPSDVCHQEGVCNPWNGACTYAAVGVPTTCDDGNPCTDGDECHGEWCSGTVAADRCKPLDGCHRAGTCDPSTGTCSNPVAPENTPCDDNSACTRYDTCDASGTCVGAVVTCGQSDQCHLAGTCDPATGLCSDPEAPNGTACNDYSSCTLNDSCQGGQCAGTDVTCGPAPDDCHEAGVCDPSFGTCAYANKPEQTPCDDHNACTPQSKCFNGNCFGVGYVACPSSDECHDPGTCDPATGACPTGAVLNNYPCDDGDKCTVGDHCNAQGACASGAPATCAAADACHVPGTCDPATGSCSNPAGNDGAACDDHDKCTGASTCSAGACVGANPLACPAPDPFQCQNGVGVCQPATGQCLYPSFDDGSWCSDGDGCTESDQCVAGTCVGTPTTLVCDPPGQCQLPGACRNEDGHGVCRYPLKGVGTPCDDGDPCTVAAACNDEGGCQATSVAVCEASDACHDAGTCDPLTGLCTDPAKADGAVCSDGNACTKADTCTAGTCAGTAVVCIDACRFGGCNTGTGACVYATVLDDGTPCDDQNPNTANDVCTAGLCAGSNVCHADADCDDGDPCTFDGCALPPGLPGACFHSVTIGAPCSDPMNLCIHEGYCDNFGVCKGALPECEPGPCRAGGVCDPATGICSGFTAANNGATCDDGRYCTNGDTCAAGVCAPGASTCACDVDADCDDGDPCTDEVCDVASGQCANWPKMCEDGNGCTVDSCDAGTCVHTTADDGAYCALPGYQPCKKGSCESGSCVAANRPNGDMCESTQPIGMPNQCVQETCSDGACILTSYTPDWTPCNDDNICTFGNKVCLGGACTGEPVPDYLWNCDDGNHCTVMDMCVGGVCSGEPDPGANGMQCKYVNGDPCGARYCDAGACSATAPGDGAGCDDGNGCTTGDVCTAGACGGSASLGGACDDKDPCTTGDTCLGTFCQAGAASPCDANATCANVAGAAKCTCNVHYTGDGVTCIYAGNPATVTTSWAINVAANSATGRGEVTDEGGTSVTERGLCWSTNGNPTTADAHATSGSGLGTFSVEMTGLLSRTTYYLRAYAINAAGTAYGEERYVNTLNQYTVGMAHDGGIIAYVNPTDTGGYIVPATDQSTGIIWGCVGRLPCLGNCYIGKVLGDGRANTAALAKGGCTEVDFAAKLCYDLSLNGGGWFLPSKDEMQHMADNRDAIGGFDTTTNPRYWTSSDLGYLPDETDAYYGTFYGTPGTSAGDRSNTYRVRCMRAFGSQ